MNQSLARRYFMHSAHCRVGLAAARKQVAPPEMRLAPTEMPLAPSRQTRPISVGVMAGAEAVWDASISLLANSLAAPLAEILSDDRLPQFHQAWDHVEFGCDDATDYDCIVLLGWPSIAGTVRLRRFDRYCRAGGSLVALGAMEAALPGWSNFAEEVFGGRDLTSSGAKSDAKSSATSLSIERSESAWHHPILDGVEPFTAEGTAYRGPKLAPDSAILLESRFAGRTRPVAWARRHRGGRVFASTLGRADALRQPSFLRLLANVIRWTAASPPHRS